MSAGLVAAAADARAAFDPTPPPHSLDVCHVPFEELTGVGEVETLVARRLEAFDRIALTGPVGCGKSSVARYALRHRTGRLAPIWINVATEDPDVGSVRGFLRILVSQLTSRAARANQLSDDRRREILGATTTAEQLGSVDTKTGGELGGSYWLLSGTLSSEVTRTLDHGEAYRSTEDVRQAARDVLELIAGHDRVPVLVCDDTDRLLSTAAEPDKRDAVFRGFFGDVLRDIADHLECAVVVAAQDSYAERDGYADMTAGLLEDIAIPILDEARQFAEIVTARVQFVDAGASARDLLTDDALRRLSELHLDEHKRSLRKTLASLRAALSLAAGEGAELVEHRHVDAADV